MNIHNSPINPIDNETLYPTITNTSTTFIFEREDAKWKKNPEARPKDENNIIKINPP
jgi:hypothetical protein